MSNQKTEIDAETFDTIERIATARAVRISLDVWTRGAHDMIRIAAFAGFDMTDLMRRCFVRTARRDTSKINIRTVETIMGEMDAEFKSADQIDRKDKEQ